MKETTQATIDRLKDVGFREYAGPREANQLGIRMLEVPSGWFGSITVALPEKGQAEVTSRGLCKSTRYVSGAKDILTAAVQAERDENLAELDGRWKKVAHKIKEFLS